MPNKKINSSSLPLMPIRDFVLPNGLRVVAVEDRFAPTVSISVVYDVGARCEKKGRSGFAHLFEHMMFQGSANVGKMQHIQLIEAQGGVMNGFTMKDFTAYYETLPSSQLELGLWLEADRMKSLAVTQKNFDNQKDVVQNEKRWRYDNNPYMTAMGEIFPAMMFENWENQHSVIGSMKDLDLATVEDIREFFDAYYAPNNAVLCVVGDVRWVQVKELALKYFGSIKARELPSRPDLSEPPHAAVKKDIFRDRFAKLPALMMGWKAPLRDDPAYPALVTLSEILTGGEDSRLYELLVKKKKWALSVSGGLGWPVGNFQTLKDPSPFGFFIHAKPGVDLDALAQSVWKELSVIARIGVSRDEILRASRKMRASLLDEYQSSENKSYWLGIFTLLNGGNPRGFEDEINRFLAMPAPKAISNAAAQWLRKDSCCLLSVIPDPNAPAPEAAAIRPADESRESAPQGAQRPPAGEPSKPFPKRKIEEFVLKNGIQVLFCQDRRIPFVKIGAAFPVPVILDDAGRARAEALSELLKSGTSKKSSRQIEQELASLGAGFSSSCDADHFSFHGSALKETLSQYLSLASEFLTDSIFPQSELALWKENSLQALEDQRSRSGFLASERFVKELFGDSPYGVAVPSKASIMNVTRPDLKELRNILVNPPKGILSLVGDISLEEAKKILGSSLGRIKSGAEPSDKNSDWDVPKSNLTNRKIILVDRPGSEQSHLTVGYRSILRSDPDYYPLVVANGVLGVIFASRLNKNLREQKGYTYGASSRLQLMARAGVLSAGAAVPTGVTTAALTELLTELDRMSKENITDEELNETKKYLQGADAISQASQEYLAGKILSLKLFNLPLSELYLYREKIESVSKAQAQEAAKRHFSSRQACIVVVGDAAKISSSLESLGPVTIYNIEGKLKSAELVAN